MNGPAPTPVGAPGWLAEVKARSEAPLTHPTSLPIAHPGVRELMESAADVPVLVAALEAVLALAGKWQEPAGYPSAPAVIAAEERAWCAGRIREVIEAALRDAQEAGQ